VGNVNVEQAEITLSSVVAQRKTAVSSIVDGEAVILSIDSGSFYRLNGVGSRIWRTLQDETAVAALCDWAHATFRADPEVCDRDVLEFLNEINGQGLITVR
jgi:hypothetical protein